MSATLPSPAPSPLADIANELAVNLLGTAMRESEAPVLEIAAALGRIKKALVRAQSAAGSAAFDGLQNDVAICIESLQYHDRLIQQLTTVRQLFGSEGINGNLSSGFMESDGSVELF